MILARQVGVLVARFPNQHPDEVLSLIHDHGTLPQGIEDVVALTLSRKVVALHQAYPHCRVVGLKAPCRELGIAGLSALMSMDDKDETLLSAEINDMLATLPKGFKKADSPWYKIW